MKALVKRWIPARWLLRQLLRLDSRLYAVISRVAVWYGDGLHPKHRLTSYHDFFVGNIRAGERVLDIGCGNGAVDYDLAVRGGAWVTGVDWDPRAVAEARRCYVHERLRFVQGDALDAIGGECFDVVVLSNVLEHMDDRVEFLRAVREKVAPNRVLVRVPLFDRDWRVPLKREVGVEWRLDATHRVEYTQTELLTEMREAGFDVEHLEVRWGEIWAVSTPRH